MTTELAASSAVIAVKGDEIEVSAATPNEMAQSQSALIEWAQRKIALVKAEAKELREAYDIAVKRKWKSATLLRHAELADKRLVFYDKLKSALEHGYIIVPSFPVQVFAVRTERKNPLRLLSTSWSHSHEQKAQTLPPEEGEYKNPFPVVHERDMSAALSAEEKARGKTLKEFWAEGWDAFEFPANMAKPKIMEATDRAMALKIFDDLGVLPGTRKNVDPIIVARIKMPGGTYQDRFVSFLIAWHLDTSTI